MNHGIGIDTSHSVDRVIDDVRQARDAGFASAGCSQIFGYDALSLLAVVGSHVPDIELVTAVVPTYPRHPIVLAAQALTVQAATGGRLKLGIGLSHQMVIEGMFGYSFEKPARHMREYLSALMPLLNGEQIAVHGETLTAATMGPLDVHAPAPKVLLAALAPMMLRLAGSQTDGTITWMTGPDTIESHIVPRITAAATEAGRGAPTISVALPVCVTDDVDAARQKAAETFAIYGALPSYQAMIVKEGADGPGGVAIVGDAESVAAQIGHLDEVGATDFSGSPYGSRDEISRTMALLTELARA
jgi:F420-dependent oxidoreductase-like protein